MRSLKRQTAIRNHRKPPSQRREREIYPPQNQTVSTEGNQCRMEETVIESVSQSVIWSISLWVEWSGTGGE